MPSPRVPHPRRPALIATVAIGLALAIAPIGGGRAQAGEIALAVVGLLALAATVTFRPRALGVCLVAFIGEFLTHQSVDGASATSTVLVATGLLTLGQLCGWVATDTGSARIEPRVLTRRLIGLVVVVAIGALFATVGLVGAGIATQSAFTASFIGVAGACALLTVVLVLLRELARPATPGSPTR